MPGIVWCSYLYSGLQNCRALSTVDYVAVCVHIHMQTLMYQLLSNYSCRMTFHHLPSQIIPMLSKLYLQVRKATTLKGFGITSMRDLHHLLK